MPALKRTQSVSRETDPSTPITSGAGDRNSLHDPTTVTSQSGSTSGGMMTSSLKKDPATTGSLPDIMIRENSRKKDSIVSSSGSKSNWYIGDGKRDSSGPMYPLSPKAAPMASREVSNFSNLC